MGRFDVLAELKARGVEGRQIVYPITQLPPYHDPAQEGRFPVADRTVDRGIHLPTWSGLTRNDINYICEQLLECFKGTRSLHSVSI